MQHVIKKGWGFDVGVNFARAAEDTPIELSTDPNDCPKPGHTIGYISGNPDSPLFFMRYDRLRVHVQTRAIGDAT